MRVCEHIQPQKRVNCRTMKRKYTPTENLKEFISESLMILMRKKNFADITIGEITDKAGVNRSSYYRNFKSKDELIKYYFNKIIFEHMKKIRLQKDITVKDYLLKMFSHFYQYRKELLLIYKNNLSHLILETFNETFAAVAEKYTFEERIGVYYHTG